MTRRFCSALLVWSALALGGCATLPDDAPVVEKLDDETGVTVARFGRPFELYRETLVQAQGMRYAFIGPFETNQMGSRDLFLWLAVPFDTPPDAAPVLEINGTALALGTPSHSAELASLKRSPYKIPTPWSTMFYYRIDAALVAQLGAAQEVRLRVLETTKDGAVKQVFSAPVGDDARFREFAAERAPR